ncbi:hypothetical protein K2173_001924 [Erythroxylum novogranatense]|uniref:ATPase AAA-type core domain-containing protein n=1 Tax=Erythroxylum novogranatense TaxID=1862640 RepID=A0AAV8SP06_9ROSI|nr:hypothetical protein K2173_001924 [Erythroxylum novogranatense]
MSVDAEVLDSMSLTIEHLKIAFGTSNPSALREMVTMNYSSIPHEAPLREVLFCGPPGCGKTRLARAITNYCQANFISVKGPELLTMSLAKVRPMLESNSCVLFFNESDSIPTQRGSSVGDPGCAADGVLNHLLTEMDGMSTVLVTT